MFRQLHATQPSILAFEQRNPNTTVYHHSVAIELLGALDVAKLAEAIQKTARRHPALQSVIAQSNGKTGLAPVPNFAEMINDSWPLQTVDLMTIDSPPLEALPTTLHHTGNDAFFNEPFDLSKRPLWRCILAKVDENRYQLCMLFHHIIIDESSIDIILKDISDFYNHPEIEINTNNFTDALTLPPHIQEQRLAYWKNNLKDLTPLNLQHDGNQTNKFTGQRTKMHLDANVLANLQRQLPDYSLNVILLGCLYALLYRYSGQTTICVGITSANRRHENAELQHLVTCLYNSIPLQLSFTKSTTFSELLSLIKPTLRTALAMQIPIDQLFERALSRETKSTLISAVPFQVALTFDKNKRSLRLNGVKATYPIEIDSGISKFELGFKVRVFEDGSSDAFIEYQARKFSPRLIQQMIVHFQTILSKVSANPIGEISMLSATEISNIQNFNRMRHAVPTATIADIFHQIACETPNEIAMVCHGANAQKKTFTWKELDDFTTSLANYLRNLNATSKPVGVCLTRLANPFIGILAVLKAGAVVVPLNENNGPSEQIKIEKSELSIVIGDNHTTKLFSIPGIFAFNIEDENTLKIIRSCGRDYKSIKNTDYPAYIMFTSGTSGEPKGVVCANKGLSNLYEVLRVQENIPAKSKIISTAHPTFDALLYDLLVCLATKGQIHLSPEEGRFSPAVLSTIIRDNQINFGTFLVDVLKLLDPDLNLNYVISMGAAPNKELLSKWWRPWRTLKNGMGGTETGICALTHTYQPGDNPTIVGKPTGMQVYILDENGNVCPPCVAGELYVGGVGLALGYNNPELTNQKFITMQFDATNLRFTPIRAENENISVEPKIKRFRGHESQQASNKPINPEHIRLYASGDYGYYSYDANGELVVTFCGRMGGRVKIHGVFIETQGVASLLRQHPDIKDVFVTQHPSMAGLTAYVVSDKSLKVADLRRYLSSTALPAVAYPKCVMNVPDLPLSTNGKINIKALPTPLPPSPSYSPEHSQVYRTLKGLWSQVLECPEAEISNNTFAELGGSSYSLAVLETLIQNTFQLSEKIAIVSPHITLKDLENYLEPFIRSEKPLYRVPAGAYPQLAILGAPATPSTPVFSQASSAQQKRV